MICTLYSCRDGLSGIDDAVLFIARRVLYIAPGSQLSTVSLEFKHSEPPDGLIALLRSF